MMRIVYVFSFITLTFTFSSRADSLIMSATASDIGILNPTFMHYIDSARYYINKNDSISLTYYLKAFAEEAPENPVFLYESAVISAKLNEKDLSLFLLNLSIEKNYSYFEHMSKNEYFPKLDQEKFERCLEKVRLKDSVFVQISLQLDTIFDADQNIRNYYFEQLQKYEDKQSPEILVILDSMETMAKNNSKIINTIIEKYGYLGNSLRTVKSRNAMFAILQHSSSEERENKLCLLQNAVKKGELPPGQYAYIEDRILSEKNNIQKYGTQYIISDGKVVISPPLIDASKVNSYRKSVGLYSLEDYIEYIKKNENLR